MANGWKKQAFEIAAYMRGKETVEGYVKGPFGIDKRLGTWRVSHIPSGLSVNHLSGHTLADCKANVSKVEHLDWSGATLEAIAANNNMTPRDLADLMARIKIGA